MSVFITNVSQRITAFCGQRVSVIILKVKMSGVGNPEKRFDTTRVSYLLKHTNDVLVEVVPVFFTDLTKCESITGVKRLVVPQHLHHCVQALGITLVGGFSEPL